MTGLAGAAAILLLLLFAPGLLRNLPQPTLAVVIAASLSLADVAGMRRLWRQRGCDFAMAATASVRVAVLGVLPGIAPAVGLSILDVFRRAWWPYQTVLGRVPGKPGYHDTEVHPDAAHLPGWVMYRFDGPLFVADANTSGTWSCGWRIPDPAPDGSWWPPSRSPTSTPPPPPCSRTWTAH